jgi:ADP-dependent NAD(P)H-hydrate dehydratase / NAD(P)H-hydrate epimerase
VDPERWLAPLLDAAAMREADRWAIDERGIGSLELMETAGTAVGEAALELAGPGPVRVVCGKGNNGGDGIVAARAIADRGGEAEVVLLWPRGELSADAKANLERWDGPVVEPADADAVSAALDRSGAIVDAIFGTGFASAPREPALAAIEAINAAEAPVVACDIASGVDASSGVTEGAAVQADRTVTFHAAKVGHRIAPGFECTGRLLVVDIGIPDGAPGRPAAGVITPAVLEQAPRRGATSNKFSSGNVLVVGGSRGLTGAVCMASEAAIRAGAGYAGVAAPRGLEPILEAKLTEVMTMGVAGEESLEPAAAEAILERVRSAACVVLGPGLGRERGAAELARRLAAEIGAPLLIDADGLNALGTDLGAARRDDRPLILTPHAGELGRMLGRESAEIEAERLACARAAAEACGGIVVLKGADTIVTDGDRVAVNALPSPGLATAGTGDVLSGTIAALVARGMEPFAGCCAAVLAHARAGADAAERLGAESVIATDVIAALPAGLSG